MPQSSLRIAMFVGTFPVPSETFILRQITGLLDLGHTVDVYAESRGDLTGPIQQAVAEYRLLERTTFLDLPPECSPWELPAWPEDGETWIPGTTVALPNRNRLAQAEPVKKRCRVRAPALTAQVLDEANYGYRARSLSALYRLDRLCAVSQTYDVLHAHFGPVGECFRFARDLWRAPLIVTFHGYDFSTVPRQEGLDCYARLFATADVVTVNSDYTWGCVERLGCPPARLRKLPMGVPLEALTFRERKPAGPTRVLTVARLIELKGHEDRLRAFAELRRRKPGLAVRYDIVGDGPLREKLSNLSHELGLEDIVAFHGTQVGPALQALLGSAHLALQGSVSVLGDQEGQGLALLEAQACGLPVVATRHGAFPEGVRDGRSGWLVQERDVAALADAMAQALQKTASWPSMGRAGRRLVESRFDQRVLNEELVAIYRSSQRDARFISTS